MIDIPTIETPRFRLRAARRDDFDEYARMWADERTTRFIGGAPRDRTTSWAKFLAMPGLWALMGYGYWIFAERDSDRPMGGGGFSNFERGIAGLEGFAEAGWTIEPDWWGKGAVSEIMAAALVWGDAHLPGSGVRCIIDDGNGASHRVAEKLGFQSLGAVPFGEGTTNLYHRDFMR